MNYLEVKVLEVTPAIVKFNYSEMSAFAKNLAEEYRGLTFDEETVKEGKKTVAELKKIQKSVNDFSVAYGLPHMFGVNHIFFCANDYNTLQQTRAGSQRVE